MEYLKTLIKNFASFAIKATFVFILVLIVLYMGSAFFFGAQQKIIQNKTFSIQGNAEREVENDLATLNLGITLEGTSVVEMQKTANERVNKAIDALKKLDIPEDKIKTSRYDLQPKYNYSTFKIDGYYLNIELEVRLESVNENSDIVGDVLSAAADSGLTEVRSLSFDVSNREELVEELRQEAISDAKSRKQTYEQSTGLRLGNIRDVQFSLGGRDFPVAPPTDSDGEAPGGGGGFNPDIQPGSTKVTSTVVLVYEVL